VEVEFAPPVKSVEPPAVDRSAISQRLENWGRWAKSSEGSTGAACMTGAICDSLRKAAGAGEPTTSGSGPAINSDDAVMVGRAMVKITLDQRRLLGLLYVEDQRKAFIAALLRIQPLDFDRHLAAAQDAIELALSMYQNSDTK
jgi:hypothetical protein